MWPKDAAASGFDLALKGKWFSMVFNILPSQALRTPGGGVALTLHHLEGLRQLALLDEEPLIRNAGVERL